MQARLRQRRPRSRWFRARSRLVLAAKTRLAILAAPLISKLIRRQLSSKSCLMMMMMSVFNINIYIIYTRRVGRKRDQIQIMVIFSEKIALPDSSTGCWLDNRRLLFFLRLLSAALLMPANLNLFGNSFTVNKTIG